MSVNLFIYTSLTLSPLLCLLSGSWVTIWILLEISTLSYASTLKHMTNEPKKKDTELSLKYFVIQSIASSLLILCAIKTKNMNLTGSFVLVGALMIKMAATPFHTWFIKMMNDSKWNNLFILSTWQKLAPVFLSSFQKFTMLIPFILLSGWVGAVLQMNQKTSMILLAFSSVFNLSWILLAASVNLPTLLTFLLIYWPSVYITVFIMKKLNLKSINQDLALKTPVILTMFILANLGGIPPLAGFVSKWLVTYEMLFVKMNLLVTVLLITSAINFFVYLRLILPLTMPSQQNQTQPFELSQKNFNWMTLFMALPILTMIL